MVRSGWNVYVTCTAGCFETSVVRRPRGVVGREERIGLREF